MSTPNQIRMSDFLVHHAPCLPSMRGNVEKDRGPLAKRLMSTASLCTEHCKIWRNLAGTHRHEVPYRGLVMGYMDCGTSAGSGVLKSLEESSAAEESWFVG